jgi:integrase/recombinase XerD
VASNPTPQPANRFRTSDFTTLKNYIFKPPFLMHFHAAANIMKSNLDLNSQNPCEKPMLRKLFRPTVATRWTILQKETVDEIIFRTTNVRNRLILELMARGGMRTGKVLKLGFSDIQDRKLILKNPKIGKEQEVVFIPPKVSDRLREYARQKCRNQNDRIFPLRSPCCLREI